ncbi:hypothetical protein [Chitinophaga sp.]|uniref:hypothetical protein n=1 Tax=Chitinophaga sp. TaxID=1869181 RepID=UPI002F929786
MKVIHATRPGLVLGFHGCEQSVRDALVKGNIRMNPSRWPYDWLGNGCYFWENSYARAYDFVRHPPGGRVIKSPAVLGAVIDLQFCLDLLDKDCLDLLNESFVLLSGSMNGTGEDLPVNKYVSGSKDTLLRHLDYAVIEHLHKTRIAENLRPYDSVRSVFIEGNELYPGAGFRDKNHIQICIRNPNCIKGYFNPIEGINWPGIDAGMYDQMKEEIASGIELDRKYT